MTVLELDRIGHAYFGRTVLDHISLDVEAAEIVALVGPSGCGKSTLIHIAAGIVDQRRGRIRRNYSQHGMIFQDPRLLPWATANDNIGYPLRIAGMKRRDRDEAVKRAANRVAFELADLDKYPSELSGGMQQRVAIARALVIEPDFLFCDEPFTALDVALKRRMQDIIIDAGRTTRFGSIFVTHDLMEAARIAHRIVVLNSDGNGITGERRLPLLPGQRSDDDVFVLVQDFLKYDPIFRHIDDVDERRRP
ncbi:ABC transporter ATP-binding protein [Ochrobactrum sp. MYb379]|uniref:ABC transporter ATP-binding protein n=1 Tax=Ochrobactrum sp. MYb379 TaxID=2745275 RepID=UPI00309632EC